ncbi:MAG TPA: endonuclease/exonuclease/phosphatase family protein [Alphaproteobacteria bacterium]
MNTRILFSNIGYARGIDGTLWQHICRVSRHFYCGRTVQEDVLAQLKDIIAGEQPDIVCFVEIDQGSRASAGFNQFQHMIDDQYILSDAFNKYGEGKALKAMPFHSGKSNGFVSKQIVPFERLYLQHGGKKLVYKLTLPDNITLFFAHFSLQASVRIKQFSQMNEWVRACEGPVMILADFNIFQGFRELQPLLSGTDLAVVNDEHEHTFFFHRRAIALDLCLCSEYLLDKAKLKIIKQPFSDHAALLVDIAIP